jgi:hypothetical protein
MDRAILIAKSKIISTKWVNLSEIIESIGCGSLKPPGLNTDPALHRIFFLTKKPIAALIFVNKSADALQVRSTLAQTCGTFPGDGCVPLIVTVESRHSKTVGLGGHGDRTPAAQVLQRSLRNLRFHGF